MQTYLVTGYDSSGNPKSQIVQADGSDGAMTMVDFIAGNAKLRNDLKGKSTATKPAAKGKPPESLYKTDFYSLETVGSLLNIAGFLAAVFAVVLGFSAIGNDSGIDGVSKFETLVPSFFLFVIGLATLALGEICKAIRVIAINSGKS